MAVNVEVRPPEALQRKIDALLMTQAGFFGKVSAIVRDSAFSVIAFATNYAPRSTGALIRSMQKPIFHSSGLAAVIGSWLPYAARQEYDDTLDHSVRENKIRQRDTKSGKVGSVIKGTGQFNPQAQAGFLRRGLSEEKPNFISSLQALVKTYADAWGRS